MATIKYETKKCMFCSRSSVLKLDKDAYLRWQAGAFVQVAFPKMGAGEREQLITGTHPKCWDENMGDEDE
jgi:hypothetical protein